MTIYIYIWGVGKLILVLANKIQSCVNIYLGSRQRKKAQTSHFLRLYVCLFVAAAVVVVVVESD